MGTVNNEALESIKNEMKGVDMANNVINLSINIPADKKEILTAFKGLINAFRSDIEVKEVSQLDLSKENKDDFNIMDYAGVIKSDIPDNIKEMKFNDVKYRAKYGLN